MKKDVKYWPIRWRRPTPWYRKGYANRRQSLVLSSKLVSTSVYERRSKINMGRAAARQLRVNVSLCEKSTICRNFPKQWTSSESSSTWTQDFGYNYGKFVSPKLKRNTVLQFCARFWWKFRRTKIPKSDLCRDFFNAQWYTKCAMINWKCVVLKYDNVP